MESLYNAILGDTPIIYFILNRSLRKAVTEMFPYKLKYGSGQVNPNVPVWLREN